MTLAIRKAEKKRAKLRLAIDGPSGSGKTWTSLLTAEALAEGGRIGVIDTEHGSASLYADRFDFDVIELDHYDPAGYVAALRLFEQAGGYSVVVIDSLSHAWEGDGGVMDIVDRNAKGGNTWSGWAKGTPAYRALINAVLASPLHVIGTMRTKTEWVAPEKGKAPVKIGTAPVMRPGVEYEFTVVADMDTDHVLTVSKSRCPAVADRSIRHPDGSFGRELLAWLNDGGDPAPEVWTLRWAEVIDQIGETAAREMLRGADPRILGRDDAWERFRGLVAREVSGETSDAASPGEAAGPHHPAADNDAGTPAGESDAGGRPTSDGEAGDHDGPPAPVISPAQLKRLAAIAGELGLADADWKAIACHVAGVESRKLIPRDRYEAVEAAMRDAVEDAAADAERMAVAGEGA